MGSRRTTSTDGGIEKRARPTLGLLADATHATLSLGRRGSAIEEESLAAAEVAEHVDDPAGLEILTALLAALE